MQVHVRAPIQARNAERGVRNEPNAILGLFQVPSFALRVNLAPVPQQLQGGFRKPVFVGASPTRGSSLNGDHDVTGSITPREGVCAGANPVGHPNFDGPKVAGYPPR